MWRVFPLPETFPFENKGRIFYKIRELRFFYRNKVWFQPFSYGRLADGLTQGGEGSGGVHEPILVSIFFLLYINRLTVFSRCKNKVVWRRMSFSQ